MVRRSYESAFRGACALPSQTPGELVLQHLERAIDVARAANPELAFDVDGFAARLGGAVAGTPAPLAALDALRHGELLLAHAATLGDRAAIARLERDHFGPASTALGRMLSPTERDEALQSLREKLFMASADGAPKLGEYAGRGSLAGWLKVVAVRLALTRLRSRRAPDTPTDDEATFELPSPLEPELDLLRAQYSGAFKVAFQSALQELDPRDRELLRLHFLENMTVDQIGASYRVHRATAARWVARARGALLEGTKGRLAARLDVPISQLDSIVDLVRSHVDVSLVRLLAADPARADSAD